MAENQKIISPLNPKAPEFSPAFHRKPHLPHPAPEFPPAFLPNPPPMFYFRHCYESPPINRPTKASLHGNVKPRKPIPIQPSRWWFCNRRNLPPRLLKPKVCVTKNRKLSAPPPPEEDKAETLLAGKTSVMVKNIPNDFGRKDLLSILDTHCRNENKEAAQQKPSSYDFLYLPMDFVTCANLGYAFVNFTSSVAAERFRRDYDNFHWTNPGNKKVCKITVAKYQGKEELSQHFKNSRFPCHSDDYLPVLLSPPSNGITTYHLTTLGHRVDTPRGGRA